MRVTCPHGALRAAWPVVLAVLLQACAGGPGPATGDGPPRDRSALPPLPPDAVPRVEPRSRYGNPRSYVVFGRRYHVMDSAEGYVERGIASWYGRKFHGRRTSSGETYDMHRMTAAHRSLPLPSYVQVTNLDNGRRTVVRVNDRGPFHDNRIIDLSYAAARKLGIVRDGTGLVEVRALAPGRQPATVPVSADPPPRAAPAPRLFLQAGAFADRANAQRLRARLASLPGAPARVEETVSGARRLFRVRLGPLAGVEQADRLRAEILAAGMEAPRLIIE